MRILIYFWLTLSLAAKYQFNLNVGIDDPQVTDTRTANGTLVQLALSTEPSWLRLVTAFTYITASNLVQGEFSIGPHIYVLDSVSKSPARPFFFIEGSFGVGSYSDLVRTDAGFGIGVGVDMNFFKSGGATIAVEQHIATESTTRTWIGIFWK